MRGQFAKVLSRPPVYRAGCDLEIGRYLANAGHAIGNDRLGRVAQAAFGDSGTGSMLCVMTGQSEQCTSCSGRFLLSASRAAQCTALSASCEPS